MTPKHQRGKIVARVTDDEPYRDSLEALEMLEQLVAIVTGPVSLSLDDAIHNAYKAAVTDRDAESLIQALADAGLMWECSEDNGGRGGWTNRLSDESCDNCGVRRDAPEVAPDLCPACRVPEHPSCSLEDLNCSCCRYTIENTD